MALGDYEDAIRALERGVENRDRGLITLRSDPIWDPLRDDPRFRSIANQVRKAVRSRPPMAPGASRERNRGANR